MNGSAAGAPAGFDVPAFDPAAGSAASSAAGPAAASAVEPVAGPAAGSAAGPAADPAAGLSGIAANASVGVSADVSASVLMGVPANASAGASAGFSASAPANALADASANVPAAASASALLGAQEVGCSDPRFSFGAPANAPVGVPDARIAADLPSTAELEAELKRVKGRRRFRRVLFGVLGTLVVVAAVAVLLATRFFPVLQIYGDSMTPTLNEGDVVVTFDQGDLQQGDVVAFCHNNKVLVKRVIARTGDWVDIKSNGAVYVNGQRLNEPYVDQLALGSCNITLPYQVPESHVFVMGDHRSDSIDSRNTAVGCVAEDQLIGELVLRVWPLGGIGTL